MAETEEQFMQDLDKIYLFSEKLLKERSSYYDLLKKGTKDEEKLEFINKILDSINLEKNEKTIYAILKRFVSLKEEDFIQTLKQNNFSEEQIKIAREKVYEIIAKYYQRDFEKIIEFTQNENLLTPFYIEFLKSVHKIGREFTKIEPIWTKSISEMTAHLTKIFDNDKNSLIKFIHENNLIEKGHNNSIGDRAYSILNEENGNYKITPYSIEFKEEIIRLSHTIDSAITSLNKYEDNIFNQKEKITTYLQKINEAFLEETPDKLIEKWANVDRAWMDITIPLQIGHPLEYYYDTLRNAVEMEWDLRILNPKRNEAKKISEDINFAFEKLIEGKKENYIQTYEITKHNLNQIQLYIGKMLFHYGSHLRKLFSAQVVPNDEIVSKERGKKIFALSDLVLETMQSAPFMKLHKKIFGNEFMHQYWQVLFKDTEKWHQIYQILTIGHEFGHILWVGEGTESTMNKTGNYKNVEEFKATTGGLMAYFFNSNQSDFKEVMNDHIRRSVTLIQWMKTEDLKPYYCEGLIHLEGLFETKTLDFDDENLSINLNEQTYDKLKEWYIQTYTNLAHNYYLPKADSTDFLNKFAKLENGVFMPVNEKVYNFVNWYWNLYENIGQEIDEEESKEQWLN